MDIEFYVPFPPTVNSYYVKTKRGVFISNKGRKFREDVAEAVAQQLPGLALDSVDKLLMECVLFPPDERRRDVDNYNKSLLDALKHTGLFEDDSQIDQLFVYRGAKVYGGTVFIRLADAGPVIPVGCKP